MKDRKKPIKVYLNDKDDENAKVLHIDKEDGHIQPLPPSESFRIGVFGPSGVGKSTFISKYTDAYHKIYKDNIVYILSPTRDDPVFQDKDYIKYIKIDDSILEFPLEVGEFGHGEGKGCCIIFDDVESITNKKLNEAVRIFRDQCYEIGRKKGIATIAVHHVVRAGHKTRIILNESDYTIFFPKSNFKAIRNMVEEYYGFTKEDVEYVRDIKSRWIYIKRAYPVTVVSEQDIRII